MSETRKQFYFNPETGQKEPIKVKSMKRESKGQVNSKTGLATMPLPEGPTKKTSLGGQTKKD